jgi:hypothetical protein
MANRVLPRARRTVAGKNGGVLKPFSRDYQPPPGSNRPPALTETLRLAREASPAAMRVLIANLRHEDPRISTMSASLILERSLGRPREQSAEQQPPTRIDLTLLSRSELAILRGLAVSGRLSEAPAEGDEATPEIEGVARDHGL